MQWNIPNLWYMACIAAFLYCSYVDLRTRRIPNVITYPFILGTLCITFVLGQWPWALVGGLLASGFLLVPRLLGGPGKAGMGDVKLALLGGLLTGPQVAISALFIAFFSALLVLLPLVAFRRLSLHDAVPFGPFLSVGFIVALFL